MTIPLKIQFSIRIGWRHSLGSWCGGAFPLSHLINFKRLSNFKLGVLGRCRH